MVMCHICEMVGSSFNPLVIILDQNKLTGIHYVNWKRNSMTTKSLVTEVSFVARTLDNWWVDSSATNHICNSLQGFRETKRLSDGEIVLNFGFKGKSCCSFSGNCDFSFLIENFSPIRMFMCRMSGAI